MNDYERTQQKQISLVLDYIDDHLNEDLSLQKLAAESNYSVYHFQRTFKALVGETPSVYVKRNRLEKAAHMLIYEGQLPITEIAHICGYSSVSYFTQSFNHTFQMSPNKWRHGGYLEHFPRKYEDRKKSKLSSNIHKAEEKSKAYHDFRWLDLNRVKVEVLPVCQTINSQHIGPYTEGVEEAWEEVYHWSKARELIRDDTLLFGVPRNNPYITPPEKSRYDCRIAIDPSISVPEHELIYPFQGGKHVIYEFEQPVSYQDREMLIESYSELYSYWLPISGYRYLDHPIEWIELQPKEGSLSLDFKIKAIALAIEPK